LVGDDLQHGIVAQTAGVVGVFVSGDDLIDADQKTYSSVLGTAKVTEVEL
jgi:hypothetical protein